MKRKIFAACALAMALLVSAGCSDRTSDGSQDGSAPDSGVVSDGSVTEEKTVSPLPG